MRLLYFSIIASAVLLGGGLYSPSLAQSQAAVEVTASAEPTEVTTEETVEFAVTVRGVSASVVQQPDRPATANLEVVERSPRIQRAYGNGRPDGVTFSWRFRPRTSGTAHIEPINVVVRGRTYRTEEIRIRVVEPTQYPSSPTLTRLGPSSSTHGKSASLDSRDLFIRVLPTANQAVQNEQVVVEYRLFYQPDVRLRHSRLADAWDAPGFWREELNVASRPIPQSRRAHGRSYQTIVLKRVAVFPTRPGELHVDPLRVEAEAQATLEGRSGASYRSRFEPIRLTSRALSVSVRDLPPGAPPSFDGAVGQYGVTVRLDEDTTAVGDPVHLVVQLRGTGNLATLSPPSVEIPDKLEAYEPAVRTNIDRSGRRIGGTKTFTYTLVPRRGGSHTLPSISFAYFDPNTRQYEVLQSRSKQFHATGAAAQELVGRTGDGLPVGDITGPMEMENVRWTSSERQPMHRQVWVYVLLGLPIALFAAALVYRRRFGTRVKYSVQEETDTATAEGRLQRARERLRNGESDASVYEAIEQAVFGLLEDRLNSNESVARRPVLKTQLERRNVDEELCETLFDLLDACDEGQFARAASGPTPRKALKEADTLLRQLEGVLTKSSDGAWSQLGGPDSS